MLKRVFIGAMIVLSVLIDTAVSPFLGVNMAYIPLASLMTVITLSLLLGRTRGMLYGLLAGMLIDISVSIPTGLISVLFTVAGFLSGYIGRKLRGKLLSSVLAPVAAMSIYEGVLFVYHFMNASAFTGALALKAGARILIGTVLVQFLYLFYNAVIRPSHSRYSTRR